MKNKLLLTSILTLSLLTNVGEYVHYENVIDENNKTVIDLKGDVKTKSTEIANLDAVIVKKDDDLNAKKMVIEKQKHQINKQKEEIDKLKKELKKKPKVVDKTVYKENKTSFNKKKEGSDVSSEKSYDSTMIVTAYTSGVESTGKVKGDKGYGLTASGTTVSEGRTISCSKDIPFGTIIDIEGVGERICEDTGSAITSGRIDLYIEDLDRAREFGVRKLKVNVGSQ